jgi:DHA1 family bicyclomycin/chloramphenicol resistance-like MFS transporter
VDHTAVKESAENERQRQGTPWRLLVLLIALSAIGPMTLNILVPAVPGLVATFMSDSATVQLTLSLYLIGLGVSQLVLGSLSDRFGRRPVILVGLTVTIIASLAALAAATISALIAARTLQAFGASTGLVVGRAIIRDLYDRDRAASMLGWVTMAMVVAPMVAPLIGGFLDTMYGWQAIFAFVAVACVVVLAGVTVALPETRAVATSAGGLARFLEEMRALFVSKRFFGYALCAAFCSSMFFAFVGGAPHVVVTLMGRTSVEYGGWFAFSALGYMLGNYITGHWSSRLGADTMISWGGGIALFGAVAMCLVPLVAPTTGLAGIFLPQMFVGLGNGILLPSAIAGAISVRPNAAGSASGVTGFLQMSFGAAAAQLVGNLLPMATSPLPMSLTIALCGLASVSAFVWMTRR